MTNKTQTETNRNAEIAKMEAWSRRNAARKANQTWITVAGGVKMNLTGTTAAERRRIAGL